MEEKEYKAKYREIASIRCEFEKALTTNNARCSYARHFWLADRGGYACRSEQLSAKCRELLVKLRENSRFIVKLQQGSEKLPHNMELRVQAGGLNGIQSLLTPREACKVENIHALIAKAEADFGNLDNLPYHQIMQSISHFRGRRSRKRR